MMDQQNKTVDLIELSAEVDQISELILEIAQASRPTLADERFFSDMELSTILKISRRTLQQWRSDGRISYYHLGGKVLYKESDVQKLLDSFFMKAFGVESE